MYVVLDLDFISFGLINQLCLSRKPTAESANVHLNVI